MNNVISQGQKSARPRLPRKSKAAPIETDEQLRQLESPLSALINHRQAVYLDTLPDLQVESPMCTLVNQRQPLQIGQVPAIQLESPIHALINGREQRHLDELPQQQESPLYALVNRR
jgi:hypothetical protein